MHSAASKGSAEFILEARHGGFDEISPRVAGFSLPTALTDTIDVSDVRISLVALDV
ncbi:MAG: hypothetical protein U5K38_05870 [Woeseiaceae bacterium]|nr:hypothetical protein [Woeseiaceae bacterium]